MTKHLILLKSKIWWISTWTYFNFDEKTSGRTVKNEIISNKQLPEELHKPIIGKFKKRKVHSFF